MSARKFILALVVLLCIIVPAAPSMVGTGWQAQSVPADTVPDGKPRYSVRKTGADDTKNLRKKTADLKDPDNLKTEVIYDEKDNTYTIGTTLAEGEGGGAGKGQSTKGGQSSMPKTSSTRRKHVIVKLVADRSSRSFIRKHPARKVWIYARHCHGIHQRSPADDARRVSAVVLAEQHAAILAAEERRSL